MLSIIVAMDQADGIGLKDGLPWHLAEDLRLFKQRTVGHKLIMGARTFLGLGRPLADRFTYVINETALAPHSNVSYVSDLSGFLKQAAEDSEEYFVCGGASIYRQALPLCTKLYISRVPGIHEVDTYFPPYDATDWQLTAETAYRDFTLQEYQRII